MQTAWQAHPHDARWIAQQAVKLPDSLQAFTQKRYEITFTSNDRQGRRLANTELREAVAALGASKILTAASDDAIRRQAETCARTCGRIVPDNTGASYQAGAAFASSLGIDPPAEKLGLVGACARLRCVRWWRRKLRALRGREAEAAAIRIGAVSKKTGGYCSDFALTRRREQKARNHALMRLLVAVNELEQEFSMLDAQAASTANPELRRNELMTRMRGFENIAESSGYIGQFWTLTAPSKYHAILSKTMQPNPNYNGKTPRETAQYLSKCWARTRAALNRRGIRMFGFRVAEPHHDGTPHWHACLFYKASDAGTVGALIDRYFLAEDRYEPGAAENRVKCVDMHKSGTATGYIAKYVAKNIDGHRVGNDDELGDEASPVAASESARRVDAWASTWGIRQFQQVGGASVTIWRELRRWAHEELRHAPELPETAAKRQALAANAGEWDLFTQYMGGPVARRADRPLQTWREPPARAGVYGDLVPTVCGVECYTGERLLTRVHDWQIVIKGDASRAVEMRRAARRGAIKLTREAVATLGVLSITVRHANKMPKNKNVVNERKRLVNTLRGGGENEQVRLC